MTASLIAFYHALFNSRQFPFNYDILTANFECPERRKRCKNHTRLLHKIELTHFAVLCKMAPSIKLAVRQARDSGANWWEDVLKLLVDCQSVGNWVVLSIIET